MTTFHDPPPHSRRAARRSERERASDEQPTVEGFTTFPSPQGGENRVDETRASFNAETNPATTISQVNVPPSTPPAPTAPAVPPASASFRPSADAAYRAAPPPLPQTQNSALAPPSPTPSPTASEARVPERTLTRRELREIRARYDAELAETAPAGASTLEVPATLTQAENPAPVPRQPAPAADANAVPHYPYSGSAVQPSAAPSPQHPAGEQKVSAYIEPPALVDPLAVVPEAASASAPPENALSVFESLLADTDGSAQGASLNDSPRSPLVEPLRDAGPAKSASELNFGGSGTAAASEQRSANVAAPQQAKPVAEPNSGARPTLSGLLGFGSDAPSEPVVDERPVTVTAPTTNLSNARAEFDELARKRLDGDLPAVNSTSVAPKTTPSPAAPTVDASAVAHTPTGHWSRQAEAKDEPNDSVISRTIGSGSSATSALVLPAIPFATDIRGPLNSNGETMLTGSIDLPHTLSASGVSDRFDRADIDSLLDLNDSDMVSTDSAPVRAVKAVSTFSNQSVTQTQKPKGTRTLTALLIAACSMAVVVAGLLVAAFAFNML